MKLHAYYKSLSSDERIAFAQRAGTTHKYLVKVVYQHAKGFRPSAELATQLEIASNQEVKRWDLIPEAWDRIWPELLARPDAPRRISTAACVS